MVLPLPHPAFSLCLGQGLFERFLRFEADRLAIVDLDKECHRVLLAASSSLWSLVDFVQSTIEQKENNFQSGEEHVACSNAVGYETGRILFTL